MDPHERELFERGVRQAMHERDGPSIDAALGSLGWRDALAADPQTAISVVFECQGETGAAATALDDVVARALGPLPPMEEGDGGDEGPALVLPPGGRWGPPGLLRNGRLSVEGLGTARLRTAGRAVVVAAGPGRPAGAGAVAAVVPTADLAPRPVSGMDPWLGVVHVAASDCQPAVEVELEPAAWQEAVRLGRLATAHQLVGAARAMLELARAHALERVQFGRPIGAFQAMRHRLADSLVGVEAAAAALAAAWDHGTPESAAVARGHAGRAAHVVARHAQQVLAGMGFTTEHPFHRYLRRVLVLDVLFGSSRDLTRSLGQDAIDRRRLPPPPPL